MSRVLYAFDISPPLDEFGRPIAVEPQSKNGALSYVCLLFPSTPSPRVAHNASRRPSPCGQQRTRGLSVHDQTSVSAVGSADSGGHRGALCHATLNNLSPREKKRDIPIVHSSRCAWMTWWLTVSDGEIICTVNVGWVSQRRLGSRTKKVWRTTSVAAVCTICRCNLLLGFSGLPMHARAFDPRRWSTGTSRSCSSIRGKEGTSNRKESNFIISSYLLRTACAIMYKIGDVGGFMSVYERPTQSLIEEVRKSDTPRRLDDAKNDERQQQSNT